MRIFVTKVFKRFCAKEAVTDQVLKQSIERLRANGPDAALGSNLVKQRISREGEGRSGGYRTIVVVKVDHRAVFLFGFAKNDKDNISPKELAGFRKLAKIFVSLNDASLARAVEQGELTEVT